MTEISRQMIERAAQGDRAAFDEIYHACAGFVFNVALRMTRNRESAQDVAQDVFITLSDKLKGFRHQAQLKTWIYRITVNKAINYMKRETRFKTADIDMEQAPAYHKPLVDEEIENEYKERLIDRMLGVLTPEQRASVVLRNIEGLSYREIAGVLHTNVNVVRSRLRRAREKFLLLRKEVMADEVS